MKIFGQKIRGGQIFAGWEKEDIRKDAAALDWARINADKAKVAATQAATKAKQGQNDIKTVLDVTKLIEKKVETTGNPLFVSELPLNLSSVYLKHHPPQNFGPNKWGWVSSAALGKFHKPIFELAQKGQIYIGDQSDAIQNAYFSKYAPTLPRDIALARQKVKYEAWLGLKESKGLADYRTSVETENLSRHRPLRSLTTGRPLFVYESFGLESPLTALQNVYGFSENDARAVHQRDSRHAIMINLSRIEKTYKKYKDNARRTRDRTALIAYEQELGTFVLGQFRQMQERRKEKLVMPTSSGQSIASVNPEDKWKNLSAFFGPHGSKINYTPASTTPKEVAEALGVSVDTINSGLASGGVLKDQSLLTGDFDQIGGDLNSDVDIDSSNKILEWNPELKNVVIVDNSVINNPVTKKYGLQMGFDLTRTPVKNAKTGEVVTHPVKVDPMNPEFEEYAKIDLLVEKYPTLYGKNSNKRAIHEKYKHIWTAYKDLETDFSQEAVDKIVKLYLAEGIAEDKVKKLVYDHYMVRELERVTPKPVGLRDGEGVYTPTLSTGPVRRMSSDDLSATEQSAQKAGKHLSSKGALLIDQIDSLEDATKQIGTILTDGKFAPLMKALYTDPDVRRTLEKTKTGRAMISKLEHLAFSKGADYTASMHSSAITIFTQIQNIMRLPGILGKLLSPKSFDASYKEYSNDQVPGSTFVMKKGAMTIKSIIANAIRAPSGLDEKQRAKFLGKFKVKVINNLSLMNERTSEEWGKIDAALSKAIENNDTEGQRLAMLHGRILNLKTTMTFFYAGLVQGESGGRAISNEDFENIFKALWGSGASGPLFKGSFIELRKTVNGILRRAEGDAKYIGFGPKGNMDVASNSIKMQRHLDNMGVVGPEGDETAVERTTQDSTKDPVPVPLPEVFTKFQNTPIDHARPDQGQVSVYNNAVSKSVSMIRNSKMFKERSDWSKLKTNEEKKYAVNLIIAGLMGLDGIPYDTKDPFKKQNKYRLNENVIKSLNSFNVYATDSQEDKSTRGFGDLLDAWIKTDWGLNEIKGSISIEAQRKSLNNFFKQLYNSAYSR